MMALDQLYSHCGRSDIIKSCKIHSYCVFLSQIPCWDHVHTYACPQKHAQSPHGRLQSGEWHDNKEKKKPPGRERAGKTGW